MTNYSVLLIDDEEEFQEHYVSELKDRGYAAHLEGTVEGGVEYLRLNNTSIKCIVLDIMMRSGVSYFNPEETNHGRYTGYLLAKKIRLEYPNIPIILLTNRRPDTLETDEGFVFTTLYKPMTRPPALCSAVELAIGRR